VDEEVVANIAWPLSFTINRPIAEVWKYIKDFNLWIEDLHYNCVAGDAREGSSIDFTIKETAQEHYGKKYGFDPKTFRKNLIVRRSEPEKLIVWEELSADGRKLVAYYVWALSEHECRTAVTGIMSYTPHWEPRINEQQLRASYEAMGDDVAQRWKTTYIPRLRQLLEHR